MRRSIRSEHWLARLGIGRWLGHAGLWIGAVMLIVMIAASLLAPWIARYDPIAQDLANVLQPPSVAHLFGTDNFGRDIFTRVLYAAKVDLQIGFLCVLFPWIIGVFLGVLAGFWGGWTDTVVMRTVDVFTAFPFLVLVIGIIAILGPGLTSMYIALTLAGWTAYSRIIRGEILVAKKAEYVMAARAMGYGRMRDHVSPHPAQRDHAGHHLCRRGHCARNPVDDGAELSGLGRAAAHAGVGQHDCRRQGLYHDGLVVGGDARPGDRRRGAGAQPVWRRPGRHAADRGLKPWLPHLTCAIW